jgi:hypothetical protein
MSAPCYAGGMMMGGGVTVAGFSCIGYTLYTNLIDADSITTPTCGTGGSYTTGADAVTWPGAGTTKANTTTSGFYFPRENFPTGSSTIMFDVIPSVNSDNAVFNGAYHYWINNHADNTFNSMALTVNNGGGANPLFIFGLYDSALAHHETNSGWNSALAWTAGDVIHVKLTINPSAGTIGMDLQLNNGTVQSSNATGAAFTIGTWANANFDFFLAGTDTSNMRNLKVYDSIQ